MCPFGVKEGLWARRSFPPQPGSTRQPVFPAGALPSCLRISGRCLPPLPLQGGHLRPLGCGTPAAPRGHCRAGLTGGQGRRAPSPGPLGPPTPPKQLDISDLVPRAGAPSTNLTTDSVWGTGLWPSEVKASDLGVWFLERRPLLTGTWLKCGSLGVKPLRLKGPGRPSSRGEGSTAAHPCHPLSLGSLFGVRRWGLSLRSKRRQALGLCMWLLYPRP